MLRSRLFKVGQLVSPAEWNEEPIDLYNRAGGATSIQETDDLRIIGQLAPKGVAVVISLERGSGCVYVLGSNGGGWAFSALLNILLEFS
jgi:hypothetical protein